MTKVELCSIISYNLPVFTNEFRWFVFGISDLYYYVRDIHNGYYCKIYRFQDISVLDVQLTLF